MSEQMISDKETGMNDQELKALPGPKIARAGTILLADEGEYSDYGVVGLFRVLADFDPMGELASYLADRPEQVARYHFERTEFVAYLQRKALIEDMPYGEFYLGSYSSSDDARFRPAGDKDE